MNAPHHSLTKCVLRITSTATGYGFKTANTEYALSFNLTDSLLAVVWMPGLAVLPTKARQGAAHHMCSFDGVNMLLCALTFLRRADTVLIWGGSYHVRC
jgi:hypothetical protein